MEEEMRTYRIGIKDLPLISDADIAAQMVNHPMDYTMAANKGNLFGHSSARNLRRALISKIILAYIRIAMNDIIKHNIAWVFGRGGLRIYIAEQNFESLRSRFHVRYGRTDIIPFVHQSITTYKSSYKVYGMRMKKLFSFSLLKEKRAGHRYDMAPIFKKRA